MIVGSMVVFHHVLEEEANGGLREPRHEATV